MWTCIDRRLILFAVFANLTIWAQDESGDRQSYADKIRATYNFRFGPRNITAPANLEVEGQDFIQPQAFLPASYCGRCHQEA